MSELRWGQPVWLGRGYRKHPRTYPSLTGAHDAEVAIVGGGITGAAVAAKFAAAGVRVAVLEAARIGRGSTAASTALLLRELDVGLLDLRRRYGTASARRIWQLSALAARDFVRTIRRLHLRCDLTLRDSIYYTTDPDTVGKLYPEYLGRCKAGFDAAWLPPGALRRLTGISGRGAIRTRGNAQLNPYLACVGLIGAAAGSGAAIFERTTVRRIERMGDGVRIVTGGGTMQAQQVIVATGYAPPLFQPLVGRFRRYHTYVLATKRINRQQRRELGLSDVMLWEMARPYHYARWTADHRLLLGGEDTPVVRGRGRAAAFRKGTGELREYFERLLPALSDVGIDYAWDGLFAMTVDGLPYIGPHRRYPRHLFALGYGGNGMTFGFLAARMLLEQWRGIHSPDHDLFAFDRHY